MKKIIRVLVVMGCAAFFIADQAASPAEAARYKSVRFKLTSSSAWSSAKLYINGRYRGRIYKHRTKRVSLPAGRKYRILVRKGHTKSGRTLNLSYNRSPRRIFYMHISSRGRSAHRSRHRVVRKRRRYRTVKFKLNPASSFSNAKLYINGKYRGTLSKRRYNTVRLLSGKNYRVAARRGRSRSTRNIFLSKKTSSSKVVLLYLKRSSSHRWRYRNVLFKLTPSSRTRWAKLYINGSYKGRVRKSRFTSVRLRTKRRYRVVAARGRYRTQKKIYLSNRKSGNMIIYLKAR